MPTYEHECACGETKEEFRPISEWDRDPLCPVCGIPMPQVIGRQAVRANYKHPILMESVGFVAHAEDVAEHRRRHPDVDLTFKDGCAVPTIRSLGQKRAYMKARGLIDQRSF